jgi:hypothetical protein
MKQFLVLLGSLLVLSVSAASPAAVAQRRDCTLAVTPKFEGGHTIYEISGERFSAGEQIRIEAVNRRTDQGYLFLLTPTTSDFSGVFIGKDADGFSYRVPPGSWRVEAKGGGCKAKTDFGVTGVPIGVWGGVQVRLDTSDRGATLSAPCAHGTTSEIIAPDANGKFEVKGNLTVDGPGPIRRFESARYTGQTDGNTMTLTVTVDESSFIRLTYTLTFGQEVQVGGCPFV